MYIMLSPMGGVSMFGSMVCICVCTQQVVFTDRCIVNALATNRETQCFPNIWYKCILLFMVPTSGAPMGVSRSGQFMQ